MKVRVLRNLGEGWPAYKEGEEVDADTTTGEALVKQGLAEAMPIMAVPEPPPRPFGVPIAEAESDEITPAKPQGEAKHKKR